MQQYGTALWAVGTIVLIAFAMKAFAVRRQARATEEAEREPEPDWPARESSEYWEPTTPDPVGRRGAFRREGNRVLVQLIGAFEEPTNGWVINRSAEGIGLAIDRPIGVGARFLVLPDNAPAGTRPAQVQVRWCRDHSDHFQVGCKFMSALPTGVRLLFG